MKFIIAAVVALASLGIAQEDSSDDSSRRCKPGTYQCQGKDAWAVCSTAGQWVFAGKCPKDTVCKFYPPSGSPYCVPPGFTIP
ncbi:uncharacterized protein MAM_07297 [Metarhizium album ARSEF 1941]|uniref:Uncharacterized protein n=1 Tax=Metarhizium album (strain ARSEF 1941) TaxID=1081103 RepID=A0A0B2WLR8_METAS|nr:uncharacterized protein MAM_07297 [Metarhizium album ARSEF 1941]KHN94878.1 hypothetical protein MAM_07297 [Metarhizium album ARSEF 1941]